MKIEHLHLIAFGPFHDRQLDFSGPEHGLHVVFGANEAGKSTALRALQGFFYGFAHKIEDAWLHDPQKIAVAACLRLDPSGDTLALTRHKRRKNDLTDTRSAKPVDSARLETALGRLSREAFAHAFGISHESLRRGVESVLAAGGDLGHAIFSATSGLNTLKQVMATLDEQQSRLFAPRAQKAAINAGLSELGRLEKSQREASASHVQWKKMNTRLSELVRQESDTSRHLDELTQRISLLARLGDALKFVAQKNQLEQDLRSLGRVPDLAPDFANRRVATQVALQQSRQTLDNLTLDLRDLEARFAKTAHDPNLIASQDLVQALAQESGVHTRAIQDSKGLRARIYQHKESIQETLDTLRPGLTLENLQDLKLSQPEKSRIQRLRAQDARIEESLSAARKAGQTARTHLEKVRAEVSALEAPRDTAALEDCLNRAAAHGNLEQRLAESQAQAAALADRIQADILALGLWKGDAGGLERLALPSEETQRTFENDLRGLEQRLADTAREKERLRLQLKERQAGLDALTQARALPSGQDLAAHRALRDRGWQSVRRVWLQGGTEDADFRAAFPQAPDLAQAYEQSVHQADLTADALREDAEAVARADALRLEIRQLDRNLADLAVAETDLNQARDELWGKWHHLWQASGIQPLSPREMLAWSAKALELRRRIHDLREQLARAEVIRQDMRRIQSDLNTLLQSMGVRLSGETSYSGTIEAAARLVRQNQQVRQKLQELEQRILALNEKIDESQARALEVDQERQAWSVEWHQAIIKLGFAPDAKPEEVTDFILALDEVFAELEKSREKQQRIRAIQDNHQAFAGKIAEAVDKLAPDLKEQAPEAAALELAVRLAQHKEQHQEGRMLEQEKRKKREALSREKEKLAALEETLRLLCADAGAQQADQLPEIEQQAQAKSRLSAELTHVEARLLDLARGQEPAEFVALVKAHDPDELAAQLEGREAEKAGLLDRQKTLVREIALAEKEMTSIGGNSRAVEIAEQAEGLRSQIQTHVDHYVKLKLASGILSKAIERYRQANQSPVLRLAGEYFKTLTKGSFSGLRADFNDKGDPILKAVRPDERSLTVQELSDGSRDQLFLALRFGGLARYVAANGPMPFIVDDVLVHFDDERSAAAFTVMGELARQTQIIFFTHHQHLVQLAQATVAADQLRVHVL